MQPTQKPITVVYSVALLSLVVMAASVLLLFGHRGHKAAALADPLRVAAKYDPHARTRFSRRSIMPLSTTGYIASGAGTAAANGNYVPVVGANATWNGATQYTYGIYFLSFVVAPGPSYTWVIANAANTTYNALQTLYNAASTAAGTTTMPLTGWAVIGAGAAAPAPTFTIIGGATLRRRPPVFF